MEVAVTWPRVIRVWWALLWRNVLALVAALALVAIFAMTFAAISVFAGIPKESGAVVARAVGFAVALLASIFPIKLVLGKEFGDFRIVLVRKQS